MATQQYDVLNTQHCTLKMIKVVHLCYIYLPQKIIMSPEGVKSEKNVLSHVTHQLPFLPMRPSHETPPHPISNNCQEPRVTQGFLFPALLPEPRLLNLFLKLLPCFGGYCYLQKARICIKYSKSLHVPKCLCSALS